VQFEFPPYPEGPAKAIYQQVIGELLPALAGQATMTGVAPSIPGVVSNYLENIPPGASEVFDLKPTSTWSLLSSAVPRYDQCTDTVDRYPRPISTSPLAYSLRNTGDIPL